MDILTTTRLGRISSQFPNPNMSSLSSTRMDEVLNAVEVNLSLSENNTLDYYYYYYDSTSNATSYTETYAFEEEQWRAANRTQTLSAVTTPIIGILSLMALISNSLIITVLRNK